MPYKLFGFIFLVFLYACGQNAAPTCDKNEIIPLLDTIIQSRMGLDEFQVRYSYMKITQIQNRDYPANGKCEMYSFSTIKAEYSHHEAKGELVVNFYNNRLCSVSFVPQDSAQYLKVLCEKSQICLENQTEMFKNKALIRKGNLEDKGFAVIWEDNCLMKELNDYITRCS